MTTPPVLPTVMPGFVGTRLPDWLRGRLRAGLGGVCLFGPNIISFEQTRALTDAIREANPQAVIMMDEEGGDVTRLFSHVGSPSPGNAVLGRIDDLALTERTAAQIGWQLRAAGCTVDIAPTVDVNSNDDNPIIGTRSFGADPKLVARHGAAWVRGLQSAGVAATAKHFPGHGDTATDSHLGLPVVDRSLTELRSVELPPFLAAVQAGAKAVMTSHILLPELDDQPATMSRRVLDLLRDDLGFSGVIVTDALDMAGAQSPGGLGESAVRSLQAGCDLLCLGTESTDADLEAIEVAVAAAVADGSLEPATLERAAARIQALARDVDATPPPDPVSQDWPGTQAQLIKAFDVSEDASHWLLDHPRPDLVVRIDTGSTIAAGPVPWGPYAHAAFEPDAPECRWFSELAHRDARSLPNTAGSVLVLGRNLHRYPQAREAIDRLRRSSTRVLVVDMGWPSDDRRYADLATFGAARIVGRALLRLLSR